MAQIHTQNFNSLNDGELDTQGGFIDQNGTGYFYVTTTNPYEGAKCLRINGNPGNHCYYVAVDNPLGVGDCTFYLAISQLTNTDALGLCFYETAPAIGSDPSSNRLARVYGFATATGSAYKIVGTGNGSNTDIVTGITQNTTYHKINVHFDNTVPKMTVSVDDGTGVDVATAAFSNVNYLSVWASVDPGTQTGYIDAIGGYAAPVVNSGFLEFMGNPQPQI